MFLHSLCLLSSHNLPIAAQLSIRLPLRPPVFLIIPFICAPGWEPSHLAGEGSPPIAAAGALRRAGRRRK